MNEDGNTIQNGGCHCGLVRYQVEGDPVVVAHCHCKDCQRLSGTGHTTGAMFEVSNFQITGQIAEYSLDANNGNRVTRSFCPTCGSQVFGRNSGAPNYVTLALGTFDDPSVFAPQVVVFGRNRMSWDLMDETLPTFETQPDWEPDDGI